MSAELAILNKAKNESGHTVAAPYYDVDETKLDISEKIIGKDTTNIHNVFNDESCIATYQFNGDANDLSGNYNFTSNLVDYVDGNFHKAIEFNNINSLLTSTSLQPIFAQTDISISQWIKVKDFTSFEYIWNVGATVDNFAMTLYFNNDTIVFGLVDNEYNTHNLVVPIIKNNEWVHIAIVLNNTHSKLYINGTLAGENTDVFTRISITHGLFVGGWGTHIDLNKYTGQLNQMRIFNKILSNTEVKDLYNEYNIVSGYEGTYSTTDLHDIFNDGSAIATYTMDGNVKDLSGNYDGVATNINYAKGNFYGSRSSVFDGASNIDLLEHASAFESNNYSVSGFVTFNKLEGQRGIFNSFYYQASNVYWGIFIGYFGSALQVVHMNNGPWGLDEQLISLDCLIEDTKHFITITSNDAYVKIYADNILISEKQLPLAGWATTKAQKIGDLLTAQIEQLRIFNRALTESEINTLYTETLPRPISEDISDIFEDNSILAHYKFNNNAVDETANYNGTVLDTTYTTGKFNKGLELSGYGNSYLSIPLKLSTVSSISLWINFNNFDHRIGIYSEWWNSYDCCHNMWAAGGEIRTHTQHVCTSSGQTNDYRSNLKLDLNTWYNVTAIYDDTKHEVYIDGIKVIDGTIQAFTGGRNLRFGPYYQDVSVYPDRTLDGSIDQIRIFNKALSHKEVLDLYNEMPELKAVIQK